MSNDLISRSALFKELFVRNGKVCPNADVDNFPITFNVKDIKDAIRNAPTAYDVDKVVSELENLKKCYRGDEDAIMKPMSFENYIQEIIDLAKAGGVNEQ